MKKRYNIGIMIGNVNAEFSYEMGYGISKFLDENNMDATVLMSGKMSEFERKVVADDIYYSSIFEYYKSLDLDGLIITYASILDLQSHEYSLNFLNKFKDIPFVLLQDTYKSDANSNVIVNNKIGFEDLMKHLILDHKYKNILYVSGPIENYDAKERLKVFKECMENYKLPLTDNSIVFGDFSDNIEEPLNKLLDNNKNIDAIVFANDTMALASYKILEKRGYIVGENIAVTGFDDLAATSIVSPSLTTVSQDAVGIGYEAGKTILELILTGQTSTVELNTNFVRRSSCGCDENDKFELRKGNSIEERIKALVEMTYDKSRITFNIDNVTSKCIDITNDLLKAEDKIDCLTEIKNTVIKYLNESIMYKELLADLLDGIFEICMLFDEDSINYYNEALVEIHRWLYYYVTREIERSFTKSSEKFKQSSYLLRNAFNMELSPDDIFLETFNQLKELNVKSAYVYLLKEVSKVYKRDSWVCPNELYLTAYFDSKETRYLKKNERIKYNTIDNKIDSINGKNTVVFSLYSKNSQYGIMVIEIPFNSADTIQMICTQLNTLLFFNELKYNENIVKKELEATLLEIEKKNEILNNISKYDELTQIYNRRGLIENAIDLFRNQTDAAIQVIFCDVDHLKEINDTFGHREGDFAIRKTSEILRKSLPKDAIVGRIGGDEFVAVYEVKNSSINYVSKIKNGFAKFNNKSKKHYYVEASVGSYDCDKNSNIEFTDVINEADKVLYIEKQNRRKSIVK